MNQPSSAPLSNLETLTFPACRAAQPQNCKRYFLDGRTLIPCPNLFTNLARNPINPPICRSKGCTFLKANRATPAGEVGNDIARRRCTLCTLACGTTRFLVMSLILIRVEKSSHNVHSFQISRYLRRGTDRERHYCAPDLRTGWERSQPPKSLVDGYTSSTLRVR